MTLQVAAKPSPAANGLTGAQLKRWANFKTKHGKYPSAKRLRLRKRNARAWKKLAQGKLAVYRTAEVVKDPKQIIRACREKIPGVKAGITFCMVKRLRFHLGKSAKKKNEFPLRRPVNKAPKTKGAYRQPTRPIWFSDQLNIFQQPNSHSVNPQQFGLHQARPLKLNSQLFNSQEFGPPVMRSQKQIGSLRAFQAGFGGWLDWTPSMSDFIPSFSDVTETISGAFTSTTSGIGKQFTEFKEDFSVGSFVFNSDLAEWVNDVPLKVYRESKWLTPVRGLFEYIDQTIKPIQTLFQRTTGAVVDAKYEQILYLIGRLVVKVPMGGAMNLAGSLSPSFKKSALYKKYMEIIKVDSDVLDYSSFSQIFAKWEYLCPTYDAKKDAIESFSIPFIDNVYWAKTLGKIFDFLFDVLNFVPVPFFSAMITAPGAVNALSEKLEFKREFDKGSTPKSTEDDPDGSIERAFQLRKMELTHFAEAQELGCKYAYLDCVLDYSMSDDEDLSPEDICLCADTAEDETAKSNCYPKEPVPVTPIEPLTPIKIDSPKNVE